MRKEQHHWAMNVTPTFYVKSRGQFLETVISLISWMSCWNVCYGINTRFYEMSMNLDSWGFRETGEKLVPDCNTHRTREEGDYVRSGLYRLARFDG